MQTVRLVPYLPSCRVNGPGRPSSSVANGSGADTLSYLPLPLVVHEFFSHTLPLHNLSPCSSPLPSLFADQMRFGEIDATSSTGYSIPSTRQSLIVSFLGLGALFGSLVAGSVSGKLGSKVASLMALTVYLVGIAVETSASYQWGQVVAGRFIGGFGVGALSMIAPAFQAEVSLRGPREPRRLADRFNLRSARPSISVVSSLLPTNFLLLSVSSSPTSSTTACTTRPDPSHGVSPSRSSSSSVSSS